MVWFLKIEIKHNFICVLVKFLCGNNYIRKVYKVTLHTHTHTHTHIYIYIKLDKVT